MSKTSRLLLVAALWLPSSGLLAADFDDLLELSLQQLGDIEVSIATGAPKLLTEAPAGTSVITAADLESMGAQTLDEALESVPGLHISRSSLNYAPRYFFRGIVSTYNAQTLMLINGVPMSRLFLGDRGERTPNQYSLPVSTIERIEIIRGPGSALYGADAFAGVINVITRGAENMAGTEITASVGSFDTGRASLVTPFEFAGARSAFLFSYQETAGDEDVIIRSDRQTTIDNALNTSASYAPAPADLPFNVYDARIDMGWDQVRLRAAWRRAWDVGNGYGTGSSLDPGARYLYEDGNMDLTWHQQEIAPDLDLDAQLTYLHSYLASQGQIHLFPPGALGGVFPDGIIATPSVAEENAHFNLKALYRGFDQHQLTLGTGYYWGDLYKSTDYRNYTFVGDVPVSLAGSGWQNTSDTSEIFQPEAQRTSYYAFAQDEWQLAQQWVLTAGVRYDDYDDVGSATNPRMALVWHTTDTFTSKIMYGEAFRVPVMSELYVQSNPVAQGNIDLKPERLHNTELAFAWEPFHAFSSALNIYSYRIKDYIDFVADETTPTFTAQNIGRIDGTGAELEVRYTFARNLQALANYSVQHTEDMATGEPLGIAPDDKAYVRLQWSQSVWQVVPQLTLVGERQRQPNDPRDDLDGYLTMDLTVRRLWGNDVSLALIGRNLADADVVEPSNGPSQGSQLPQIYYDLPQQGRSLTVELEVHL